MAAAAAAIISTISAPAVAGKGGNSTPPPLATCSANDITATYATILACDGFRGGNLLNQSNAGGDQTILQSLGYSGWDGKMSSVAGSVSNLKGNQTVDFGVTLTGISIIGVHYGNGQGGPGESTAFYVLDAAQGINQIHLAYNASSNAVLFVTGLPRHIEDSVPEPATWLTMIAGFGVVGAQMRRRRRTLAAA